MEAGLAEYEDTNGNSPNLIGVMYRNDTDWEKGNINAAIGQQFLQFLNSLSGRERCVPGVGLYAKNHGS